MGDPTPTRDPTIQEEKDSSYLVESKLNEKKTEKVQLEENEESNVTISSHEPIKDKSSCSRGNSVMMEPLKKYFAHTHVSKEGKMGLPDHDEGCEGKHEFEQGDEGFYLREYLAFMLSGEEYSVDIMMIKEIIKPVEFTHVPRAPEIIMGIISLRGTILPILNLRKKMGLIDFPVNRQARIVVVSSEKGLVGLLVDSVTGVVRMSEPDIEPPPSVLNEVETVFIKGVGKYRDRFIIFMDINKVLSGDFSPSAEGKVSV
ncbi:MAG TPA: chemotaxis protein CheW [Nitrospiria bacterium]